MTPLAVLAVGEAMVELSASDEAGLWHLGYAGDTLNTAWYLRRLLPGDQAIGYLTRLGQGGFSRRLSEFIFDAGIVTDHVSTDPMREVGLYAIDLSAGERSFTYWRGQSAARGLADDLQAQYVRLAEVDAEALAACETVQGAGRDMQAAGTAVSRVSREVQSQGL